MTAAERIAHLALRFSERDATLRGGDPLRFDGYTGALERARASTGLREAAVWGAAEVDGVRCVLIVLDFSFLGGSMGVAVGEKVARAFDAARTEKLPVVAVTASGGARMQEGMVALVQMAKTAEARRRHAHAGLGAVTLLTSPTTGGVYASFASLADVILAEPEAQVGFAGPRVVAQLTGTEPRPGTHTAAFAYEHGLVDAIVEPTRQPAAIGSVLRSLSGVRGRVERSRVPKISPARTSAHAWERVQLARDPFRPKGPDVLDALLSDAFELRGDRSGGGEDASVRLRIGALRRTGVRVVALAQDASGAGRMGPAALRKAVRGIGLAGRLGLPLVSLIDTRGAEPGPEAEAAGVAEAIATTLRTMLDCPSPTLAVVTGEGGSGGALAMAVADRVLSWEHAIFSVIAPEGAASILFRDASRAPELAGRLRLTSSDLVELGVVDRVVPEPDGGAQTDADAALAVLAAEIAAEIGSLASAPAPSRLGNRRRRWRRAGNVWVRPV